MDIVRFRCSTCGQLLRMGSDKAGRKAKCARCESVLTIPAQSEEGLADTTGRDKPTTAPRPRPPTAAERAPRRGTGKDSEAPPAPEEEEDEAPARPRRKGAKRKAAWKKVQVGLVLLAAAAGVHVLSALILLVAGLFAGKSLGGLLLLFRVAVVLLAVQLLLEVTGYLVCLFVPNEQGARVLAAVLLVIGTLGAAAGVVMALLVLPGAGSVDEVSGLTRLVVDLLNWVSGALPILMGVQLFQYARLILIPLFLKLTAHAAKVSELSDSCDLLLKLSAAQVGLSIAVQLLLRVLPAAIGFVALICVRLSSLLDLAWTALSLVILWQLVQAAGRRAGR